MRRPSPAQNPGLPTIEHKSRLADEMLRELAPLLAEEGIDVNNIDVPDLDTLQAAMNRAVKRRNMQLFSPVGQTRDIALATLGLVVEAILEGDTTIAGTLLDQVQPESPDNSVATVASCIGIAALGLLDDWLSGQAREASAASANTPRCPPGTGAVNAPPPTSSSSPAKDEHSAPRSLDMLITRQGSPQVLAGSALALAALTHAWAKHSDAAQAELIHRHPLINRYDQVCQQSPCCDARWNPPV